jgi:hypothetical protein
LVFGFKKKTSDRIDQTSYIFVELFFFLPQNQDIGSPVIFTAKVDCSNMGLFQLPERLPANTIELNVSNNNVMGN